MNKQRREKLARIIKDIEAYKKKMHTTQAKLMKWI